VRILLRRFDGSPALSSVMTFLFGNSLSLSLRERTATFYFATDGTDWENNTNWVQSSTPECTWYGVYCNEKNQVINLTLRKFHLFM
jgi:hypothetical protein